MIKHVIDGISAELYIKIGDIQALHGLKNELETLQFLVNHYHESIDSMQARDITLATVERNRHVLIEQIERIAKLQTTDEIVRKQLLEIIK